MGWTEEEHISPKNISPLQMNYNSNYVEAFKVLRFIKSFRYYMEGWPFKSLTDNQILRNVFMKKDLSRRESRWLQMLGKFGIFPITLQHGKINLL